jgi:hypothetical protein
VPQPKKLLENEERIQNNEDDMAVEQYKNHDVGKKNGLIRYIIN